MEQNNPQPRQNVNRYQTATSVEYSVDNIVRSIKWFTDIQMAYNWIINKVEEANPNEWTRRSFESTADRLEERWRQGKNGLLVAKKGDIYKYRVFYNPEENEAIRAIQNQILNH